MTAWLSLKGKILSELHIALHKDNNKALSQCAALIGHLLMKKSIDIKEQKDENSQWISHWA